MDYGLALQLKEARWPYGKRVPDADTIGIAYPSLEQLIEACGEEFCGLSSPSFIDPHWKAFDRNEREYGHGSTPAEAVARLWLALNTKKDPSSGTPVDESLS